MDINKLDISSLNRRITKERNLIADLRNILDVHQDTQSQRFVEIVEEQIAGCRRKIETMEARIATLEKEAKPS